MNAGKHIPRPEGGPTDVATVKECLIVRQEGSKNYPDVVGSDTPESGRADNISLGRPTKRLRFLTARNAGDLDGFALDASSEVTFLPMEAIGEQGDLDLSLTRPFEEVKSGYSRFRDGDVVVAKITPCFENGKGALIRGTATGIGFGTTELHVLSPGPELDGRFLYYVTIDPRFRRLGEACMTGAAGQQRVPEDFVRDFRIPVLLLPQQRAIADYLDHETARVDALIAAKGRLLGLLAEKRRALITRAVTRGLDPHAPLRDSGIPWLGEIPAHWDITRLKFVARVQTGIALGKDYGGQMTSEFPYLRVANVQDGFIDLSEVKTMVVPEREAASAMLRRGDVLMNEGGDADKLGRGAIWDGSIEPCLHQNHVFALRPMSVSSEWLSTWTGSDFAKAYFETRAKQSTNLASISSTNLLELPIAVSPEDEQQAIVEHITRETTKLDAVRATTERTVALLKERRAALIAAAVIGQLDAGVAA